MANPLFQNILPEDIPVMLKRLNAYTKSYRKDEYIKHAGDPADFIGIIETGSIHVCRTITTATAISQPPSPVILCSARLLPVRGFLIFLWTSWLRKTAP